MYDRIFVYLIIEGILTLLFGEIDLYDREIYHIVSQFMPTWTSLLDIYDLYRHMVTIRNT